MTKWLTIHPQVLLSFHLTVMLHFLSSNISFALFDAGSHGLDLLQV